MATDAFKDAEMKMNGHIMAAEVLLANGGEVARGYEGEGGDWVVAEPDDAALIALAPEMREMLLKRQPEGREATRPLRARRSPGEAPMISASDVEWAKNFGAQRGRRYGIGEDEGASIALVALWEAALAWSPAKGKAEMRSLAYSKISWAILDERRRVFGDWRRSSQVATWVTLDEAENESVQPSQEHRAELHLVAKASVGLGRRKEWLLKEAAFERILPAGRKSSDCRARQAARKELKERLAA